MYLQYKTIKEAALLENNTMVVLHTSPQTFAKQALKIKFLKKKIIINH